MGCAGQGLGKGCVTMLPAVLLICMANSVKYILTEAIILDTVLYMAVQALNLLLTSGILLFSLAVGYR